MRAFALTGAGASSESGLSPFCDPGGPWKRHDPTAPEARARGIPTLEINLAAADNADLFDDARYGRATEAVPAWVGELLGGAP